MSHDDQRRQQQTLVEDVVRLLARCCRVLGVCAGGSYARGTNDRFSDLDLDCYLADEERTGRAELYEQVGEIAPLLCKLWVYDRHALYLFADGIRLDLNFNRPSEIKTAWRDEVRILYDPAGTLARNLTNDKIPAPPQPTRYFPGPADLVDWFFWMFRQVYGWTKRAQRNPEKSFDKLNASLQSLVEIRNKLIEIRLQMHGDWGYLNQVDPDLASRLAETFPEFKAGEILTATRRLLVEFERIVPGYCQQAGCVYPADKTISLKQILDEWDREA